MAVTLALVFLSIAALPTWTYEFMGWHRFLTPAPPPTPQSSNSYPAPGETPTGYPFPPTPSPTPPPGAYLSNGHYVVPVPVNYAWLAWSNRFWLALPASIVLVVVAFLFAWRHSRLDGLQLRDIRAWARKNRFATAVGSIILVGLIAGISTLIPIVPIPANSPIAGALLAVFSGIDDAPYQMICRTHSVDELSLYYANTPDFGSPSDYDQTYLTETSYITPTLGPEALDGAGLLTAKEAIYIWFYHLPLHATVPNAGPGQYALQQSGVVCDDHSTTPAPETGHVWVNTLLTVAVVTQDDCDSLYSLFRKIDGHWKIVKDQIFLECPVWHSS